MRSGDKIVQFLCRRIDEHRTAEGCGPSRHGALHCRPGHVNWYIAAESLEVLDKAT